MKLTKLTKIKFRTVIEDVPASASYSKHDDDDVESQPQNPEFRHNPENVHQCKY